MAFSSSALSWAQRADDDEDLEPSAGAMISDNIRLTRRIAEGGMGSVWHAWHLALDRPVAVKFMRPSAVRKVPDAACRFTREARLGARLRDQPSIAHVLDYKLCSADRDAPYIVMDYLEGETLAQCIARRRRLPAGEVASVVVAIARALDELHRAGIVHRDIKPENIYFDGPERKVKILDFGVAKDDRDTSVKVHEEEGMMFGTPYFMSPEQFANAGDVDRRCDLWALAVVAYEALTGKTPFAGVSLGALYLAAARADFVPPSRLGAQLTPALDAWFRTAFAPNIEDRFSSAAEMGNAFLRASETMPDVFAPLRAPRKLAWPTAYKLAAMGSAAVLLSLVTLRPVNPTPGPAAPGMMPVAAVHAAPDTRVEPRVTSWSPPARAKPAPRPVQPPARDEQLQVSDFVSVLPVRAPPPDLFEEPLEPAP